MYIAPYEILLLVKLLLAHILTDFVFQTKKSIKRKQENLSFLVLHGFISAIVAVLLYITGQYGGGIIYLFLWTMCTHTLIDWAKIYHTKKDDTPQRRLLLFTADQMAHIAAILFFWITYFKKVDDIGDWITHIANTSYILAYGTGYIFLTVPVSIIIREIMKVFAFNIGEKDTGMMNAGSVIGILERILIFTFVIMNQYTAIGFLVAAKSILRISDRDENFKGKTEYIIIGTLLSFGVAILTGELAKMVA